MNFFWTRCIHVNSGSEYYRSLTPLGGNDLIYKLLIMHEFFIPQACTKLRGYKLGWSSIFYSTYVIIITCCLLEGMIFLDCELSFLDFETSVFASASPTLWPLQQLFDDHMCSYLASSC